MDQTNLKEKEKIIEAVLFAAGHPISYDKLSEVLELSAKETEAIVKEFAKRYNEEDRGIMMLTFASGCQLCTREEYLPYIKEALGIRRGGNLSASSLEVLAIIAYNQPATRAFVDAVRGVDSSYAVSSLIDKGLIEGVGRLDAPGRPVLYGTTEKFLRVFGINSLDELPETEPLAPPQPEQLKMEVADKSVAESDATSADQSDSSESSEN